MKIYVLSIAAATVFSNVVLPTMQRPSDYDLFPIDHKQYCTQFNTETCQKLVPLVNKAHEGTSKTGVPNLTPEEAELIASLIQTLVQEIGQKEGIITIKDTAKKNDTYLVVD